MNYTESISWILDKYTIGKFGLPDYDENKYAENIAFVHSLGLKCDCVGWSHLDLSNPRKEEILFKIAAFCKENEWKARAFYERKYVGESDWYFLETDDFDGELFGTPIDTVTDDGEKIQTKTFRAYRNMDPSPKNWWRDLYLPERFRNFCLRNGIEDLDFCWVKDIGKYEAEQYFHGYGKRLLPKIGTAHRINNFYSKSHRMTIDTSGDRKDAVCAAGGAIPELLEVFGLQRISLPNCIARGDLPEGGIAYVNFSEWNSSFVEHTLVIHKDVARALIEERVVAPSKLKPVLVVDELPGGYDWMETSPCMRPALAFREKMLAEYEKLKNSNRPARNITEKDALKALRRAKKEHKEEFEKALPKAKAETLRGTEYQPMIPYYTVANAGYLSDEYRLLSYVQTAEETAAFFKQLETEELSETKPEGYVIAKCPDGDCVLLCENGNVIRFSHEAPEILRQWTSLASFIFDALMEAE